MLLTKPGSLSASRSSPPPHLLDHQPEGLLVQVLRRGLVPGQPPQQERQRPAEALDQLRLRRRISGDDAADQVRRSDRARPRALGIRSCSPSVRRGGHDTARPQDQSRGDALFRRGAIKADWTRRRATGALEQAPVAGRLAPASASAVKVPAGPADVGPASAIGRAVLIHARLDCRLRSASQYTKPSSCARALTRPSAVDPGQGIVGMPLCAAGYCRSSQARLHDCGSVGEMSRRSAVAPVGKLPAHSAPESASSVDCPSIRHERIVERCHLDLLPRRCGANCRRLT